MPGLSFSGSCGSDFVQNLPDLQVEPALIVLLNVDVDGEMCVDISHLVLVALGDTNDQVLDDGFHGPQGSDILSRSVVDFDLDELLALLVLGDGECDGNVREILDEFSYREAHVNS